MQSATDSTPARAGVSRIRVFAADVTRLLERVIAWDGKAWDA